MGFDRDDNYYDDELHYQGFSQDQIEHMSAEERSFHSDAARGGFTREESISRWVNEHDD